MNNKHLVSYAIIFVWFSNTASSPVFFRGKAIKTCDCRSQMFDETPEKYVSNKGEFVGDRCARNKDAYICENGFARSIVCPKECLTLIPTQPLTKKETLQIVNKVASQSARSAYQARISSQVMAAFSKKHPLWLPTLYNPKGPYIADYKLMNHFFFKIPLQVKKKKQTVSIIFFFKDIEYLLKNKMSWSFWDTDTGEFIHESIAPYGLFKEGYLNTPCPVPIGPNLNKIALYGQTSGPSDAFGCCGPYSLEKIDKYGPIEILNNNDIKKFEEEVVSSLCSSSTDLNTGRYSPKLLHRIIGPAKLKNRAPPPTLENSIAGSSSSIEKDSAVAGVCQNNSLVAALGSKGEWYHVYCNGTLGWLDQRSIKWNKRDQ